MIFAKPLKEAYKTGVNVQNISADDSGVFFKFKSGAFDRICKDAKRICLPMLLTIVNAHDRFF